MYKILPWAVGVFVLGPAPRTNAKGVPPENSVLVDHVSRAGQS